MRILYVEDNPQDADLARRALARQAPEVSLEVALTLKAAIARLAQAPAFDLVLADLLLPDGSGLELLAHIRAQQLPLAVVLLTGSGDQDSAIAALKSGADDYLTKRDNYLARLPQTLRRALARFEAGSARKARPLCVLYAEHNAFDIDLTRRHLAQHTPHIELAVVSHAEQVLARLPPNAAQPCAYDVVLLDYRLPGMDALELVKLLRDERGLSLPIVLITGQGSEEIAAQALHLGVDDYLTKHTGYLFELPATLEKVHRQALLEQEQTALRASNRSYDELVARIPAGVYRFRMLHDGGQCFDYVSPRFCDMLELDAQAVLADAETAFNRAHPDDLAGLLQTIKESRRTLAAFRWEGRFVLRGESRWARLESSPSLQENGDIVWDGVQLDITERQQAEQVQQVRNEVLDQLIAKTALPVILADIARQLEAIHPEMRVSILLLNPGTRRLSVGAAPSLPDFYNAAVEGLEAELGRGSCGTSAYLGETVIGQPFWATPWWRDNPVQQERLQQALLRANGGQADQFEATHPLPDGRLITVEFRASPIQIGSAVQVLVTGIDITERKRIEDVLRQSDAVIASTRDGVMVTDLDGCILSVNPAFTEITGYPDAEVFGQNPRLLQSGRQDRSFYQGLWASLLEVGHWQGEIWNRRKNGEIFPEWLTLSTVLDEHRQPSRYVAVFSDISQIKQSEARLEHLAHYDALTQLPNRLLLFSRLEHSLLAAQRDKKILALLMLDLDHFKDVNDSLGHLAGDELLQQVAQRLSARLRGVDTICRLGGDEFTVLLDQIAQPEDAAHVAQEIIAALSEPWKLSSGAEVRIGASVGISLFPDHGRTAEELLQQADTSLYQAKAQGRGCFRFFSEDLTRAVRARIELEARLRRAIEQGELRVFYQPQVDIASGRIVGAEALVRWQDPVHGLIAPAHFIPLAEETGLISAIGNWVLRETCRQGQRWITAGLAPLNLAVNLSPHQFLHSNIEEVVSEILIETGFPANRLELELTESALMERETDAIKILQRLRALGVRLAIDDFGTGYSSLAYLKRFPLDVLKIDKSFIDHIPSDADDQAIAATIIAMAHTLRLQVLAEGVETQEQLDFLRAHGCHSYQGYLTSRPVPADAFVKLLAT